MRGKKRAREKGLQTWARRGADEHVSSVKVTNSDVSGVELLELFREGYVADAWSNRKTTGWLGWSIQLKMVCGISITVWLCLLVKLVKEF
jgi:hypothetical protein